MKTWANTRIEKVAILVGVAFLFLTFLFGGILVLLGIAFFVVSGIISATGPYRRENLRTRAEVRRRSIEIMSSIIAVVRSLGTDLVERDAELEKVRGRKRTAVRVITTIIISAGLFLLISYLTLSPSNIGFPQALLTAISDPVPLVGIVAITSIFLVPLSITIWSKDPRTFPYRFGCSQARDFLNAINGPAGSPTSTGSVRIAAGEAIADRWIRSFVEQGVIDEIQEVEGSKAYLKTDFGKKLHEILRNPNAVGVIIRHLSHD